MAPKNDKVQLNLPNDVRARLATLLEGGKGSITAADLVALSKAVQEGHTALRAVEESAKTEKVGRIKAAVVALRKAIDEEFAGLTEYMVKIEGAEEPQLRLKRGTETVVALGIKAGKGGGNGTGKYAGLTRKQKRMARKTEKAALAAGKSAEQAIAEAKTAALAVE